MSIQTCGSFRGCGFWKHPLLSPQRALASFGWRTSTWAVTSQAMSTANTTGQCFDDSSRSTWSLVLSFFMTYFAADTTYSIRVYIFKASQSECTCTRHAPLESQYENGGKWNRHADKLTTASLFNAPDDDNFWRSFHQSTLELHQRCDTHFFLEWGMSTVGPSVLVAVAGEKKDP